MGYDLADLLTQLDALAASPPPTASRARAQATARDAIDLSRTFTRDALRAQLQRNSRLPSSWRALFAPA